jgi:hypothetical protein
MNSNHESERRQFQRSCGTPARRVVVPAGSQSTAMMSEATLSTLACVLRHATSDQLNRLTPNGADAPCVIEARGSFGDVRRQ